MDPVELEQILSRSIARDSLADWSCYTNPQYIVGPPHRKLINALERVERGECRRLMVFMPPRVGKSEGVSVNFPPWFLGRNPDKRVILASYGASLAYIMSRKARNLLTDHGEAVFGNTVAKDSSAVDDWSIAGHRGGLAAVGVDGPATGKGADLAIIDDPVKDMKEALSEVVRSNVKDWYRSVLRTRLHPGASVVLLQTRWHEDDLAGWLLEEMKSGGEQWEVIIMPFYDEEIGTVPEGLIWPARFASEIPDMKALEEFKRTVGSIVWDALYQQAPTSMDGGLFKRHFWRFWAKVPGVPGRRSKGCSNLPSVALPPKFDNVVISVDATFKDGAKNDFVSITTWGSVRADRYLLRRIKRRLTFTETLKVLREEVKISKLWKRGSMKILVEDKANGSAIIDTLTVELGGIIAIEPDGGKEARASAVQPSMEGGNVYLPEDDPTIDDYIGEFASFPKGKHDDEVDSTSQALLYLRESTGFRAARGLANL